ncbi:MAG: hypothetical protein JW384_01072 [Nitrosomonadaceae bacterium]|nr:hypothetical protein [Nitrosomonadaceae bacterium]
MPDISIFHVQGREPRSNPHCRCHGQEDKQRQRQHRDRGNDLIEDHHCQKYKKGDQEIQQTACRSGKRDDQSWKRDFSNQMLI